MTKKATIAKKDAVAKKDPIAKKDPMAKKAAMTKKASTPESSTELTPAVLGIDIGSVSSRAYLYCPSTGKENPVSNPDRTQTVLSAAKFEKADFSSMAYPFDDDDDNGEVYEDGDGEDNEDEDDGLVVYGGESTAPLPGRQGTSLKYAPYILVNCTDVLLKEYALLQPLLAHQNDSRFRRRLRRGLKELFKTIKERASAICESEEMVIRHLALTIPVQWTLEFEDLYAELAGPIFEVDRANIYFCSESEALANCLLRCHGKQMKKNGFLLEEYSTLIFFDFGGHNMNGCIFQVVSNEKGMSFFRVDEPFGAGGGSEHWEHNIDSLCSPHLKIEMDAQRRQQLRDGFCRDKAKLDPFARDKNVQLVLEGSCTKKKLVEIPMNMVKEAWEEAHRGVLEVAKTQIASFTGKKKKGVFVIVSGGTARHQTMRRRLLEFCKDAEIPEPLYAEGFNNAYDTALVAKGAAFAVGRRITVRQFFTRGGCIGLQQKQGTDNTQGLWDNEAGFLVGMLHVPHPAQQVMFSIESEADELQLICEPYRPKRDGIKKLHHSRCYNLLTLGRLPVGRYKLVGKFLGSKNDVKLELKRFRKNSSDGWELETTSTIPLYFEPGANCVFAGKRGQAISDLNIPGIPWVVPVVGADGRGGSDSESSSLFVSNSD
ncbi:hypothetical protein V8F20_006855 [Naviculisporaceae sp. PSN 640]